MPRRVVPIWRLPSFRSRAPSSATCQGMIRCALPERKTSPAVTWPRLSRSSSSSITTCGSTTQPAPIARRLAGDDPRRDLRGSCRSRRRRRSCARRSGRPGSGRRGRSPGRAGRRSCPCPRRPTAHRRSRWQARAPFLQCGGTAAVPPCPTCDGSSLGHERCLPGDTLDMRLGGRARSPLAILRERIVSYTNVHVRAQRVTDRSTATIWPLAAVVVVGLDHVDPRHDDRQRRARDALGRPRRARSDRCNGS